MKHSHQIVVAFVGCILMSGCARFDEDALASRFRASEGSFARLASLSSEDAWIRDLTRKRVDPDAPPLNATRLAEYRRLFTELRIEEGLLRRVGYNDVVFFIVGSSGMTSGGTMYGYAFSPTAEVGPVVEKIDPKTLSRRGMVFRKIENGWYVFFSVEG
jgi:hypothetical protein